MRCWQYLGLVTLLSFGTHLFAESDTSDNYKVSYVYDGDTVLLQSLRSGEKVKLRISDIDAPERNQSYGIQSRRALIKLCKGRDIDVSVDLTGIDLYERRLGKLYCNNTNASLYLLEQGLAWHNTKYSSNADMQAAAAKARNAQVGLWESPNPTPPWVWRLKHRHPPLH